MGRELTLKLPRLSSFTPIINPPPNSNGAGTAGSPTAASIPFARVWDTFATAIESAFNGNATLTDSVTGLAVTVPTLQGNNLFQGANTFENEPNSNSGYEVAGQQVIGPRQTGWTAGSGTPNKGAFNANTTQVISVLYTQAEVQAIQDSLVAARQRILALEQAMRTHGMIN